MLLSLYRGIFGPTVLDRMIGVNAIGTKTTVMLILIGLLYHRLDMFVDIALAYALLNFIVGDWLFRQFPDAPEGQLTTLVVAKHNGPSPKAVEPFDRVDEVTEKRVTAHFSVGYHIQPSAGLYSDGLIDGAILDLLEFRRADGAGLVALAGFLEEGWTQQTAYDIAAVGRHSCPPVLR